ncbi:TPA: TetR family transcriptional regulator [Pseudomonas aeruginosa]|uniref:TetR/AcrR family transcriptional regulator n=1 Tax=Pseudomonas aeruginosa TaxID=287 RepID=UPI00071B9333|nr:TetR family transcriptional regulator [Pseudomonas aeruginosa]KSQ25064.1 TetR family transcriptional regulator [Pseudomonas aeruginosa]MCO1691393.1 TetR/AcrR family transcriptional regulator [Pseudomonas aeruginosa]MCO1778627.1 TetR/AcrR family transcriptional regulator [Pseudomonas aeruginosa]MCO1790064.1 TetR/AcrR family transcriptional regulator [Pseudomonas aeruginosa]MCO1799372.1 TetR/AcrR family transcriptional regulator [Pseudomonas aeruginosa]
MSRIEEIRSNAIQLIALHGFGAVSLRQLAKSCGLQAGSLYAYYRSKDDLLLDLITSYMEDLLQSWQDSAGQSRNPRHCLEDFVAHHLSFQSERKAESLIASMDLRSLPEDSRQHIIAIKACYERELKDLLASGADQGLFTRNNLASTAILSMLTGLGIWQEGCDGDPQALIPLCQRIALQIAGAETRAHLPAFS